jgi:hypothetical protein
MDENGGINNENQSFNNHNEIFYNETIEGIEENDNKRPVFNNGNSSNQANGENDHESTDCCFVRYFFCCIR